MPDRSEKILILGGTKEAAELAVKEVNEGHDVTTSLAGRTKEPAPLAGKVRIGGFGGAKKLADWLVENAITRLIDATHPFAEQISRNAQQAAQQASIHLEIHVRPPWQKRPGDIWHEVGSLEDAAEAIPADAWVLLTLGSQYLQPFHHRNDVHFVIRMVDKPKGPLPFADHKIVSGKPSTDWRQETDLLKRENITHIVCRNSGGEGAYAKIKAARELGLAVIILKRG